MSDEHKLLLKENALSYFLKYAAMNSRSNPDSDSYPSSDCQLELGRVIVEDLLKLGLSDAYRDKYGYVYATVPASVGLNNEPISFIAHMDTSPSEPGDGVRPVIHKNFQGKTILYEDDPELSLNPADSPELLKFIGEDIITASGKTLLGADDKAGIAAIMSAAALMLKHPEYSHPEIRICFTPDEEVGRGVDKIDISKLGKIAYTIDGGELGELEAECFDAWSAHISFKGRNVHPGSAKNVMLNAGAIAARFTADIPEWQTPEHTEKREGFYHLTDISGDENAAELSFILRDFELAINEQKMKFLESLIAAYQQKYPGLEVTHRFSHSYQNMYHILEKHPEIIEKAASAMEAVGIKVLRNAIRGGTDGARLCYMGIPTPNIFSGGLMYHSRREWIPVIALQKAAEVIVKLAELYA